MTRRVIREYITVIALAVLVCSSACGSSSPAPAEPSPPAPSPAPAAPSPQPQPEPPPQVSFGAGRHLVGVGIAPGRYFADPSPGCYWERQSGDSGSSADRLAFAFVAFDAGQWIVDVAPGDRAFQTNEACGTWTDRPRGGPFHELGPGMWLVGEQVLPGLHRASTGPGCYWERLQDFSGTALAVIARDLVSSPTQAFVTLASGDAGFSATAECGAWTRVNTVTSATRSNSLQ